MKKIGLFLIVMLASGSASMSYSMHKLSVFQSKHIEASGETKGDKPVRLWDIDSYYANSNFFQTPCEPVSKFDTKLINTAFIAMNIAGRLSTFMDHFSNAFSGEQTFIKSKGRPEDKKRRLRCCRYMKKFSTGKGGMVKANL